MAAGRKTDGKKAKIASRAREDFQAISRRRFSTRPEDVVERRGEEIIARDGEGNLYRTQARYVGAPLADPNRYGRPASRLSASEAAALLGGRP